MPGDITEAEIKAIERTWSIVNRDLKGNGVKVFLGLFKAFPQYQQLFKRFKDVPLEELENTASLRAHGSVFMHGLAALVDNLEDTDTLIRVLQDNVERHYKRNIHYDHFKNTLSIIPGFLQSQLGSEMDNDATTGWQKVLDIMDSVIKAKLEELESDK